jgi:hypothetical protein
MSQLADIPAKFRRYYFQNAGGPSRKIVSREVIEKKWQLVTLDCSHRVLLPKYQMAGTLRCGFCGGSEPMA